MGERTPDQPLTTEELEKLLLWANPTEKAAIRASHELLRRRLADTEEKYEALRKASGHTIRRMGAALEKAQAAARDRQPPQTTEGTES